MKQEDKSGWDKEALKDYVSILIDEYFDETSNVYLRYDKNCLEISECLKNDLNIVAKIV